MEYLEKVLSTALFVFFIYAWFSVSYIFFYSFLGLFKTKKRTIRKVKNKLRKFVVYIPAYKEDAVIVDVANTAMKQNYNKKLFDVVVIADSLKTETLNKLRKNNIEVIEVSFEKSTKSKALNFAMKNVEPLKYDVALILDADNVMKDDFLTNINMAFNRGFQVVQGHRIAKNLDTNYAILDAISEEINNNIYSVGHRVIGMSSRLIGSGMAFDFELFRKTMKDINAVGGFDKELELKLMKSKYVFEYVENAYVYDEKVNNATVMTNQRSRWISAQFYYLRRYLLSSIYHLVKDFNLDFFNKALQMALPPRVLLPGVLFFITIIALITSQSREVYTFGTLFMVNIIAYVIAIPRKFYNKKTLDAVIYGIPNIFLKTLLSIGKMTKANKTFIHTPHTNTKVDESITKKNKFKV
ncbi:MAG: glycosyltransferase family 2 protein [Ichthyobacteriaceae bacterium]|nr:glycosyltransferase family 2 protein [Ichthyobacteriaceae bacterium]